MLSPRNHLSRALGFTMSGSVEAETCQLFTLLNNLGRGGDNLGMLGPLFHCLGQLVLVLVLHLLALIPQLRRNEVAGDGAGFLLDWVEGPTDGGATSEMECPSE